MEEPPAAQVSSFPLPPMQYIGMYTDENVARGYAPAPPPPIHGHYTTFGAVANTEDPIIQPLEAHGIRRLYPFPQNLQSQQPSANQQTIDRKAELKKINHSILAAYLDLLEMLIRSAMNHAERERKLEDLQLLFINFHHLINEYRPHQARETLKLMLEVQAQERLNVAQRFQRHFDAVVANLQKCLREVPDELCSATFLRDEEYARFSQQSNKIRKKLNEEKNVLKMEKKSNCKDEEIVQADFLMCQFVDGEFSVDEPLSKNGSDGRNSRERTEDTAEPMVE